MDTKIIRLFLLFLAVGFITEHAQAQAPVLNKYTFGEGLKFSGERGYEFSFTGYAQPYFESKFFTEDSLDQNALNRFRMRRLRLRFSGSAAEQKVDYRLQVDLSGVSEVGDDVGAFLLDAWIAYNITKRSTISFGQRATPTDNRELRMNSETLQLVERSRVTSAFSSIREFGLFYQGDLRFKNGMYLRNYLAVTNGDGLNVRNADFGGFKYGGRIDFLPFGLFTFYGQFRQVDMVRENSPKLVVGASASLNKGMSSRRGRNSGAILYLNDSSEVSLPDYFKAGVDFLFKYKGFSALGEIVTSTASVPDDITTRVRNDGSTSTSFDVDGEQNVERYVKGRMMLGTGYNIQMGYIFKSLISVDARYTHLQADEDSFLNNGTFYNRPNYYTLGVSKYFARNYGFKIQSSVTYVDLAEGSTDINGLPISGNEIIWRIITSLSF